MIMRFDEVYGFKQPVVLVCELWWWMFSVWDTVLVCLLLHDRSELHKGVESSGSY